MRTRGECRDVLPVKRESEVPRSAAVIAAALLEIRRHLPLDSSGVPEQAHCLRPWGDGLREAVYGERSVDALP